MDVQAMTLTTHAPGVYAVDAEVTGLPGRSGTSHLLFSTDVDTGEVHVTDDHVMRGPRLVVSPERYGPRLGRAWVTAYVENIARSR